MTLLEALIKAEENKGNGAIEIWAKRGSTGEFSRFSLAILANLLEAENTTEYSFACQSPLPDVLRITKESSIDEKLEAIHYLNEVY